MKKTVSNATVDVGDRRAGAKVRSDVKSLDSNHLIKLVTMKGS